LLLSSLFPIHLQFIDLLRESDQMRVFQWRGPKRSVYHQMHRVQHCSL
jgi:hypothetical protein